MKKAEKVLLPPRVAEKLLRLMFPAKRGHMSVGDFAEAFHEIAQERGHRSARIWYWLQILSSLKALVLGNIYWSLVMIKSYLKIAFRNFKRQKTYTFINMFGLTTGIATCLVIFLFVNHELSYDNFHPDLDRIYRIVVGDAEPVSATSCAPVAQVMQDYFPEVETVSRILATQGGLIGRGEINFYENTRMFADDELFSILDIPFSEGDPEASLDTPATVVINHSMAEKYFGDEPALGKILKINEQDYEVTGVADELPLNTHFKFDYFIPMKVLEGRYPFERWFLANLYIYIKVKPGTDMDAFSRRLATIAQDYAPKELLEDGNIPTYSLQPVKRIHLYSHLRSEIQPGLNPLYLYVFSAIGLLILVIACINYINLSTARSIKRAREVGVRKVLGAHRRQLIRQFFGESTVIILAALFFAVLLLWIILPFFNSLTGKEFSLGSLLQPVVLGFLALLIGFVGFSASGYPALFLSAFQPSKVLKLDLPRGHKGAGLRKILVVSQFAISITLIAGTLIVFRQLDFMKNENLGFEKDQKLVLPVRGILDISKSYETVKAAFLQNPNVTGATAVSNVPGQITGRWDTELKGSEETLSRALNYIYVDPDYAEEFGLKLAAGRFFQKDMPTDVEEAYILNQASVKEYGWASPEDALGKNLVTWFSGRIIGVVEDFHYQGLHKVIEPLAITLRPQMFDNLILTVNTRDLPDTLAGIKNTWAGLFPGQPCDYYFFDTAFNRQYLAEERLSKLLSVFTVLGVMIACLGLLGLASFTAEQKTKEIGIRKVLGATSREIVLLLTREFSKWVVISTLIAWPVTYLIMSRWLENFAYRVQVGIGVLLVSALIAVAIALFTVSYQSLRAATADPVNALKYE